MEDKTICGCYGVKKSEIVKAIKAGADTVEKVGKVTKAGTGCGKCKGGVQAIIDEVVKTNNTDDDKIACGCYKVTKGQIKDAIKAGADTVEKVGKVTKAGTGCGKCKGGIQTIIDEVTVDQVICGCYGVKKGEIVKAIKNGAATVEEVGVATKAGTGCGRCKDRIEDIIKEINGVPVEQKGFFSRVLDKVKGK